ncbi:uncharacterized protein METZ01_LOCUS144736, partial [marine metagenome]
MQQPSFSFHAFSFLNKVALGTSSVWSIGLEKAASFLTLSSFSFLLSIRPLRLVAFFFSSGCLTRHLS